MSPEIILVLVIAGLAILLFVTGWLRYDLVGLGVLLALVFTGLISAPQALDGLSNPAIITIASVLVLSGGLYRTGVANLVGKQVLRLAGGHPARVTFLLMLTAGVLSGIMNNIAAIALLLPVALGIAGRLQLPVSKLLIPLAFASLLGGMTTLIGTAPNILVSAAGIEAGLEPFGMFAFAPVGFSMLALGIAYMVLLGQRLIPVRRGDLTTKGRTDLYEAYELEKTLFTARVPDGSSLAGRTLAESRVSIALGASLLGVLRNGLRILNPPPGFVFRSGDRLVLEGRREAIATLREWKPFVTDDGPSAAFEDLESTAIRLGELEVAEGSPLVGETLASIGFRDRYRVHVVAVRRGDSIQRLRLRSARLQPGDLLLTLGRAEQLEHLEEEPDFSALRWCGGRETAERYGLEHHLLRVSIPEGSVLDGQTLAETRLGRAFDLTALEFERDGEERELPAAWTKLQAGDRLVLAGQRQDLQLLHGLQQLDIDAGEQPRIEQLESEAVAFAEVTLSPRTRLVGKSLKDLAFREKYGLTVVAIWRGDRAYHSNVRLRDMKLEFGDALLLYGPRNKLALLAGDPDFLVLAEEMREGFRVAKAPIAAALMAGVVLAVSFGLLPIYIAAPTAALLMVVTGCLTPDEAYNFIELKMLVLIVGMLSLGLAMEQSGATALVADTVLGRLASLGSLALIAGLFLVTALAAQFMPTSAVAVLMAPIALSTAAELSMSPYALLMVVAVGTSCAFMTPFGHPVNLLVMGVGGYRVTDYTRVGVPLIVLALLVVLFILPVVWPLVP